MTHVVKLFGDTIVAEQTGKGTYIVRNGEKVVSPYEYTEIRQLTPRCYRLFRPKANRHDLIFANGVMEFGFQFVYELARIGKLEWDNKSLVGIMFPNGTGILDDYGNFLAFIPGLYHISVADDKFLVALLMAGSEPYVKVYTMWGEFLSEGFLSEAIEKAKSKVEPSWA
jgi:hypothetical protein